MMLRSNGIFIGILFLVFSIGLGSGILIVTLFDSQTDSRPIGAVPKKQEMRRFLDSWGGLFEPGVREIMGEPIGSATRGIVEPGIEPQGVEEAVAAMDFTRVSYEGYDFSFNQYGRLTTIRYHRSSEDEASGADNLKKR